MADKDPCHEACLEHVESVLMQNSSRIPFLVDSIEKLGCKIPQEWIKCAPCDRNSTVRMSGGFTVDAKNRKPMIIICENERLSKATLEDTLVHELIHAYDICRAKIDWMNCLQHACTEVRASSLSGECTFYNEIKRGNMHYQKGYQACVKRRAFKSVSYNPNCVDIAKDAVDTVFDKCFNDTSPYDTK